MFITLLKRQIVSIILIVLLVSTLLSLQIYAKSTSNTPNYKYTVVIDAGHGGIDGGSVGVSGVDENYLNLQYALCLKKIISEFNMKVVMTRTNLNGLYSQFASNKKKDDMEKRKTIVENSGADLVISIHMNSFVLKSCKGAQVFYKKDSIPSKTLADSIQAIFVKTLKDPRKNALVGDYFMLNEFEIPSVIVECGYISNAEEDKLLQTESYRELVCYSIFLGIVNFLAS